MSKTKSTTYTIPREKFEELAGQISYNGETFCDKYGIMWCGTIEINALPVTIIHNVTDERYLVTIPRGPRAQKARKLLGVI